MKHTEEIPEHGYLLPKWDLHFSYRATALAYMQRENVKEVKNKNGKTYSFDEINNAILGKRT